MYLHLGTHNFQNISIKVSNASREVRVVGDFISGSEAIGILIITYSLNNESNIHYTFSPCNVDTCLKGLPDDQYNVKFH